MFFVLVGKVLYMVIHKVGNLVKEPLDAFVHQANCFCTMKSGIAKTISEVYPEAVEEDLKTIRGDKSKLGTYTHVVCYDGFKNTIIVNMYSQYDYGYDKKIYTDIYHMKSALIIGHYFQHVF